ncbi:glycosyltransferase family 25 protein [Mesorhizobium sp.]|uniref:glycosyltransferase family 25 protein n=1 Tax=Mesorhizobium sp. TaxID=1871066 RepID=UPI0025DD12F9|nr:glycosyltransferase family 25 protein [Mesorhizobium sp.]
MGMKCLVINLDRSVDRLAHVTGQFARIGIGFERVAAVDAANGSPVSAPRMSAPEICCFLSHRLCWQIVADGSERYVAIFEDDVAFAADAGPLLSGDGWVPADADLVKLETFFVKVRLGRRRLPAGGGYSLLPLAGRHVGSAGYVLSRAAAQKLLKRTERLKAAVDETLFCPTRMTCSRSTVYQLVPALCVQTQFLLGDGTPSLVQIEPPERQKRLLHKIGGEAWRAFAHLRNGTLFQTDKVEAVAFRDAATILPRFACAR